jgi:hypothetical protein
MVKKRWRKLATTMVTEIGSALAVRATAISRNRITFKKAIAAIQTKLILGSEEILSPYHRDLNRSVINLGFCDTSVRHYGPAKERFAQVHILWNRIDQRCPS